MAEALVDGGLRALEVTLRTPAALEIIPDRMRRCVRPLCAVRPGYLARTLEVTESIISAIEMLVPGAFTGITPEERRG